MIKKLCLLLCALPPIASSQQTSSFHFSFDQPFGNYPVGFRVVEQYDRGRPALADSPGPGRPLQTLIWYPANADKAPPMTLGDFEDLIARETSFDAPTAEGRSQNFVHAFIHGTEPDRTVSLKDAKPQGKKFPVVVYAPSINAPNFENIELCEYLASYGFVVIASPSMGASNRHMEVNPTDAHAQAADILFLLAYAKTLNDADSRETAVIGYSWGGTGGLLAAADDRIRALVAFDGSFRYSTEPAVDPASYKIPLLFFCRGETSLVAGDDSEPAEKANASILNGWKHGDLLQIRMLAISHIQFSSLFQRSDRFKSDGPKFAPAGYSLQEGSVSYGWIARYTEEFLAAYLKHDRTAQAFLKRSPAQNQVPPRLMETTFRPAP